MSIIPYDEDLYGKVGAFISPNGKIYHVKDTHESFCEEFIHNIQKNIDNNQIAHYQWELYTLWKGLMKDSSKNSLSDFMVFVLYFDKVEKLSTNTISTTNPQPHIRFYNYYLMDWNILFYDRLQYNKETHSFDEIKPVTLGLEHLDAEAYYEIEDIKTKVLKPDRHLFFK